ncbi:O-acetylhomoserine sulfhydrylase [Balneicella halophila]|uniref:O-acetylhomoserine sulfhydrylase n=1 Tax=Balneicella halophila TaxID=1537566 RepID=A0A7L4USA3_BALHA|nr:O-acetylhomoserine aminocarboxypropyltransferase/cysteine synthase family protein [Balneicella halophila]PVX52291.1 O-acetylhomoserine sulfhydrylase [Balneicella halophila]
MTRLSQNTQALHIGHNTVENAGTRAVPIYQTSGFVFENTDHAADLFSLKQPGYIYTRLNNPTNDILEKRLAAIERGIGAAVFASGMSAISTTLLTLLKSGDHIVASNSLYGGTFNLLSVTLPRFGIETSFVDSNNLENIRTNIHENTKVIFIESLGNPKLDIPDIEGIAKIAHENKIPLIVDNTVTCPLLLNPITYGANIVVHSLTKYISGQGTTVGGAVIDAGTFDWASGKFPEFTEPSKGYDGFKYVESLGELAFISKLRLEGLRDFGGSLNAYDDFQIIQGLETLDVRIQKHSKNALELAKWLEKQEEVDWVNYPGLVSSEYYELAQKYLSKGQGGLLTFGLKGGYEAAKKFSNTTKLFALVANLGDTKSLLIHPASTTHQQFSKENQIATGVTDNLIRPSVGLEDVEDLKNDLLNAFKAI